MAIELCCTGDPIDGKEAHRIGLANHVYPPDKLLDGAKALAKKIATMRLAGIRLTRTTCKAVYDMDYNLTQRFQDACFAALTIGHEMKPPVGGGKR
jgi:enoyl-CoA hydratase